MAYLALYRKYRPRTFDEIVGQRAVVTSLKNQVRYGQIGHAYLFCGTRGTGKTSTAKVFARAVNCLHPVDGNPCNECELCREGETDFNVIEIDAASNNGVDSIRDLREDVQYTPSRGKYKVYIIDEVHMLSAAAFNALLKTLEEPPEHVIFILATTDPQKVLPTIVSRCQRYNFRRLSSEEITKQLVYVCEQEKIEAEEEALHFIAAQSDGGMRDALSILDQCHAYYIHEKITLSNVEEVLGAVDHRVFSAMTQALYEGDTATLLDGIGKVYDTGRDALQFVSQWVQYLRHVMVARVMGARADEYLDMGAEQRQTVKAQASQVTQADLTHWIEALSQLEADLRLSTERRVLLEIEVIRLCAEKGEGAPASQAPAAATASQAPAASASRAPAAPASQAHAAPAAAPKADAPAGTPALSACRQWDEIRAEITKKAPYIVLRGVTLSPGEEADEIIIHGDEASLMRLSNKTNGNLDLVQSAIEQKVGHRIKLVFRRN